MRAILARRIAQVFFLALFVWVCLVSTPGAAFYQWRGWPINWFLQLDPLIALATVLTTRALYAGLAWALLTIILTFVFGRVFCGWFCPFGTLQQVFGWIGKRGRGTKTLRAMNRYRGAQKFKYILLAILLAATVGHLFIPGGDEPVTSLQIGLFDPICVAHRGINLVLIPLIDAPVHALSGRPRAYEWALWFGLMFGGALIASLWLPRFYCRYVCPLGALLGVFSRLAVWRIGRDRDTCVDCLQCERHCEGACTPSHEVRVPECVVCLNCLEDCGTRNAIAYTHETPSAGEVLTPDITRREVLTSFVAGAALPPIARLSGKVGENWHASLVRPPGAVSEAEFLARCIKCGQCMRVCPTNVIQPAGTWGGIEAFWTPVLNNRIGTSGCQLHCVACGHACPTGAIRPITLDEKLGQGEFADAGPIRLGTAFVDRGRCLPWAMNRPCIVCEENCPVTPKAIKVQEVLEILPEGRYTVVRQDGYRLTLNRADLEDGALATGDQFVRIEGHTEDYPIRGNGTDHVSLPEELAETLSVESGVNLTILVRLQRPVVDPELCIGCGTCEHECPVSGKRAIRITAENESRDRTRSLLPGSG